MKDSDLTELPEGWRPDPGDTLIGKVVEVTKGWSDYSNDYYPILVVQPSGKGEDPVSVHAFHNVLRNKLVELKPQIGETVGIKCGEKVKSKDGKRDIQTYIVRVDGRKATDVWGELSGSPREATTVVGRDADDGDDIPF